VPKNKYLSIVGEGSDEWGLLSSGAAEIIADDKDSVVLSFLPGSSIGEVRLDHTKPKRKEESNNN
jgi:hypothetical protein